MNILLDTYVLLWVLTDDPRLSPEAIKLIESKNNVIFYSVISIWEVELKKPMFPNEMGNLSSQELVEYCDQSGLFELPLEAKHVRTLESLSRPADAPPHNDPFDRMLISQAKSENMIFLTHDVLLPYYSEDCIVYV